MTEQDAPGRRERNRADKLQRIQQAARALFAEQGYSGVTTQEVARRAEVGTGTLFRYARSKGELLCMIANENFRARPETDPDAGPVDAICALAAPYVRALSRQPENSLAYHRETIFGEPGVHRSEALAILQEVQEEICRILAGATGREADSPAITTAGRAVFDVLYLEMIRIGLTPPWGSPGSGPEDLADRVRAHVTVVVEGVLPSMARATD